jgi:hypothetical protein
MNENFLTGGHFHMIPSGILAMEGIAGGCVRCRAGRVWMTVEGDNADYWILPDECAGIRSPGQVVIEAAEDSEIRILPAQTSAAIDGDLGCVRTRI